MRVISHCNDNKKAPLNQVACCTALQDLFRLPKLKRVQALDSNSPKVEKESPLDD